MKTKLLNIQEISVRKVITFLILLILIYKLISDSLLWIFLAPVNSKVFCFICFGILFFIYHIRKGRIQFKKIYNYFIINLLLAALLVSISLRQDSFWITDLCLLLALIMIIRLDYDFYEIFAFASSLAVFPFILRWLLSMVRVGEYLGNRGPIHFTTVALLLVSIMYIRNFHWKWQFITLGAAIFIDFIGQSRTYMVICLIALLLLTYFNFKGKITAKKLGFLFLLIIFSVFFMINFQNQIMELFINKWSEQTTIFTGRSMMWIDVLSEFHFLGYKEGYIEKKYLLGNVHNAFIQAYVSYGIIVGALYCLLIIRVIIKCIKYRENKRMQGLIIAFIPITIAAFFESNFIIEQEYVYLGICNALLIGQIIKISNDSMRK